MSKGVKKKSKKLHTVVYAYFVFVLVVVLTSLSILCGSCKIVLSKLANALVARASVLSLTAGQGWVSAYYGSWNQSYMPPAAIDFTAFTHLIYFSIWPATNGTIFNANGFSEADSTAMVQAAHAAGKKILISVGGGGTETNFASATSSARRATFINNLVAWATSRGYDGVDVDWEPLSTNYYGQYEAFIIELRTALNRVNSNLLLTAATNGNQPSVYGYLHTQFNQVNLMDMSGTWVNATWHNTALYSGGGRIPGSSIALPNTDDLVNAYVAAGVPKSKLGIAVDFYGYYWSGGGGTTTGGATKPGQTWTSTPTITDNVSYYNIAATYGLTQGVNPSTYRWDSGARAAYLSLDNAGSANDRFVSYDNEVTVQSKVDYINAKGLSGLIIWELTGGYQPGLPAGQRNRLLQAVKTAVSGGVATFCVAGSLQSGSQCLVCNSAGSAYTPNNSKCTNGRVCSSAGQCVDTTAPSVAITAPANGASVSGTSVPFIATASDNVGVVGVQFKLDGVNFGSEDTVAPYSTTWNTTNKSGTHSFIAVARDAAGNATTSAVVSVTIANQVPPTQANLIVNPSFETAGTSGNPASWFRGGWGANTASFIYPTVGADGNKAAKVQISTYTSGDAKWYFSDVPVVSGRTYTFTESYKSSTPTELDLRYQIGTTTQYQYLSALPASTTWATITRQITIPLNATKLTVFHVLNRVGTLETDAFSLIAQ